MPIIPATLSLDDSCIVTEALVDSGSAYCIFDAQFANMLCIQNVEEGKPVEFEGISGKILTGFCHHVTLGIGGNQLENTPIVFVVDMPDNAVNILGQLGFFEHCTITLNYAEKEVSIIKQ